MTSVLPNQPSFWKTRIPFPFSIRGKLSTVTKSQMTSLNELERLPSICEETVDRVITATRLWDGEKMDVARELVSHFRDALEAGVTPAQATESFGDPRAAAKSIRAAKLKNRPLAWRIGRRFLQGGGAIFLLCVLAYGIMAVRYYLSSPSINRNYAKELATQTAAAEEMRAYPIYRDFWIRQYKAKAADTFPDLFYVIPEVMPGEVAWEDAKKYCIQFAADLAELRRGALLPIIGAPITNADDPVMFSEVMAPLGPEHKREEGTDNPDLIGVLMPHQGWTRSVARSLMVDARVALAEGDVGRFQQNMLALLGVSRQLSYEHFFIGRLNHVAIVNFTTQEIRRVLTHSPHVLSESQLTELAHTLAASTDGTLQANFDSEQLFLEDWIQRSYTDDGNGDGHLTAEGFNSLIQATESSNTQPQRKDSLLYKLASPVAPTFVAGRKEIHSTYLDLIKAAKHDASIPLWQRGSFSVEELGNSLTSSPITKARLQPVLVFAPTFSRVIGACETVAMIRDATLAAIALEIHHRRSGTYPDTLAELTPSLLPKVPIDIWDGNPLKYLVKDGKPVLYTVGSDKIDNGGARTDDDSYLNNFPAVGVLKSRDKDWLFMPHIRRAPTNLPVKTPAPSSVVPPSTAPTSGTLVYPKAGKS